MVGVTRVALGGAITAVVACSATPDAPPPRADSAAATGDSTSDNGDLELEPDENPADDCHPDGRFCEAGNPVACYEGPPGTEGKGSCAAGARLCNLYGTALGGCLGQVLPRPDNCASPTSWICDDVPASCGVLERLDRPDLGALTYSAQGIASDGGSGFARAYVIERLDLPRLLIIEREVGGTVLWSNTYELLDVEDPLYVRMAVDGSGATIVTASFNASPFPLASPAATAAAVVMKFDASGALSWANVYEPGQGLYEAVVANGLAVSQAGDVWITGWFTTESTFGGVTLEPAGEMGAFVLRLEGDGTEVWVRTLESTALAGATAVAVDEADVAYVGGFETNDGICGSATLMFASFDGAGQLLWQRSFTSKPSDATPRSIALATDGGFYASGRIAVDMGSALELGGEPLDGFMFLAKFDALGNPIWSRSVNDLPWGPSVGGQLALDPAGHLYWVTQDDYTIVVRVYDPTDGYLLWMKRIEVPSEVIVDEEAISQPYIGLSGFAMAPDGRFAIAGSFTNTIDFGQGQVSANALLDAYFAVLVP